jgi:transcriptional regulator GlxA family with amidase domain
MATSSGVSAGTDMSLAVIARLYGRERADGIAALAEYEWQDDPARDPFLLYLNQGDLGALAATFQRDEASKAAGD